MKTYYAVTQGVYSDYSIVTITDDKDKAERIAIAYGGQVEEYEDSIINPVGVWYVTYYELSRKWDIYNAEVTDPENFNTSTILYKLSYDRKQYEWCSYVKAADEETALKIAYDKYAQWKAEREGLA